MTPGNDSEHVRDCNCVAAACQEFGCAVAAGFATRPLVEPVTTCDCCGAIGHTTYHDEPARRRPVRVVRGCFERGAAMTLPADEREHVLCDEADSQINELEAEVERLRQALQECQNTSDAYVYRVAGNALAGRRVPARAPHAGQPQTNVSVEIHAPEVTR